MANLLQGYAIQHVNSKVINFDRIGWKIYHVTDDCITILITKGYESLDNPGNFYFFRPAERHKPVVYPVVIKSYFDADTKIIRHDDVFEVMGACNFDVTRLRNSKCVKRLTAFGAYVDKFGRPLTEVELLDILKAEKKLW